MAVASHFAAIKVNPARLVPAEKPVLIEGRFLRGAIVIAANGVPIFNPQKNRGDRARIVLID